MGIVCFFQADAKVGLAGERAGETVIESKQRTKDDRLSGNPNQMNIQSMYSDIDLS